MVRHHRRARRKKGSYMVFAGYPEDVVLVISGGRLKALPRMGSISGCIDKKAADRLVRTLKRAKRQFRPVAVLKTSCKIGGRLQRSQDTTVIDRMAAKVL